MRRPELAASRPERWRYLGAVHADELGIIRDVDAVTAEAFGYRVEGLRGAPLTMLMPERFRRRHEEGRQRFLATGETHAIGRTLEVDGLRRDGSEFPIELTVLAWKEEDGWHFAGLIWGRRAAMPGEESGGRSRRHGDQGLPAPD